MTMTYRILLGNWRQDASCKLSDNVSDHDWVDDTVKDERFACVDGDQYCKNCHALKVKAVLMGENDSENAG
jgi:hypothetical protein